MVQECTLMLNDNIIKELSRTAKEKLWGDTNPFIIQPISSTINGLKMNFKCTKLKTHKIQIPLWKCCSAFPVGNF